MKKFFITLTMVLLGLFAGVNNVWADDEMTPEQAETYGYWARLTAKPAVTTGGSGKVCVRADYEEPADGEYNPVSSSADNYTAVFVMTSANIDANFNAYYKANPGSYFTGWSFTDGGTDLGKEIRTNIGVSPSSTKGHSNIREYTVYGAFEPIRIVSYEIEGDNTISLDGMNMSCTDTVTFRAETPGATALGSLGDEAHFKLPTLTPKAGTSGTWSTSVDAWRPINPNMNIALYGEYAELTVPVTFTAPNNDPGEYAATLTLETYAGVKMTVYLYARTVHETENHVNLYDENKVLKEGDIPFSVALDTYAASGDIIQLLGNYNSSNLYIDKDITLDLNGFDFTKTLTIGGDVTIAYSPYGGRITQNVTVTSGGELTANGGRLSNSTALQVNVDAEAVINGATIGGSVTNDGTLTLTDGELLKGLTSSGTLTISGGKIENASGAAVTVSDGTATINRGSISGSTYGVSVSGGTVTIEKLAAVSGDEKDICRTGGAVTVNNGKFSDPNKFVQGTITFNAGFFKTNTGSATSVLGKPVWKNTAGVEYKEGYVLFAGNQASAQASNISVCRIGQTSYSSLEDALAYANNNPTKTILIFMENDYTLPAGYYTLPANATLVVPMDDAQDIAYPMVKHESAYASYPAPYVFRTLTFADGVNMTVAGALELSCSQYHKVGDAEQGIPGGPFGRLVMKSGSRMIINNGGELRAWGYVTGDGSQDAEGNYLSGEIDARRGGVVREQFQIGDWKGGDVSFTMIMDEDPQRKTYLFPVYEYFIQNIEAPVKYHPGSALFCAAGVDVQGITAYANEIKVVGKYGEPAMFLMDEMADAENTWVRKWYDVKKDQQVYEVNSGAQLGSMLIDMGEVPKALIEPGEPGSFNIVMDSRKFVLPLTNNMKIHLLSGSMQFTQSTSCLPGMEVEVDKESTISVIKNGDPDVVSGALYFYDSEQWGRYVQNGKYGTKVHYSATLNAKPNVRDVSSAAALGDATLNVHGTFQMDEDCAVYTTVGKTQNGNDYIADPSVGGANIISSNADAGTFVFYADAPAAGGLTIEDGHFVFNEQGMLNQDVLINYDNVNGIEIGTALHPETPKHMFGFELCTSARLKNTDGSFVNTYTDKDNYAVAGDAYCFMDDRWRIMQVDNDNLCFLVDRADPLHPQYYAKPQEYVAIIATKDGEGVFHGNDDHTFSDAAGTGRLFILMDECQWWEVENEDNLYHCIHPENDTYYYWDETANKWKEKRFTITWKNWDGTPIETVIDEYGNTGSEYSVTYGTMAEFLGSNPTREANIDYTYDFTGWAPALGKVTSDVTYTATYQEKPRKYTIIFQNEGGVEIERQFLTHNAMPVCENVPTKTGFTLEWSPAVAAVTGDAIYTVTWLEVPPTEYEITFYDYNGTSVLQQSNVAVGAMPEYTEATPSNKPATSEFTYEFDHWSPAIEEVSATSAKTYIAVYHEVAKTYTVIFQDENGSEIERHEYTYGAMPVCSNTPTKDNTAEWTYGFAWTPQIQTVMGSATYQATFPATKNKYTVTLRSNNESVCSFTGAGIYDYGTEITIGVILNSDDYEFLGWEDDESLAQSFTTTVTGDISLMAKVTLLTPDEPELYVDIDETLDVPDAGVFNVGTLIIASDGESHSAQIKGSIENLKIWDNAIFYLQVPMMARTWYAVAVPWIVDVAQGIYGININTDEMVHQEVANTFDIIALNSAANAAGADPKDCWNYVDEMDGLLHPGKAYMIYLTEDQPAGLLFFKKSGTPLLTTTTNVTTTGGDGARDNWNAIANPALYHAALETGATLGQKYHGETDSYESIDDWNNYKWIVADPIFVQATTPKTIVAEEATGGKLMPARRAPKAENDITDMRCTVELTQNGKLADRLFIATTEEKDDAYIIGQDVAKMGVSNKIAQMWVNRYDTKLCMNTIEPMDNRAEYPLSIFAPKAGEYTISLKSSDSSSSNAALYLTHNGEAVWNLSERDYVLYLDKGTTKEYGLRVSARSPQVVTGCDEIIADGKEGVQKVLVNDKIFIIRGERIYTIDGQLVK